MPIVNKISAWQKRSRNGQCSEQQKFHYVLSKCASKRHFILQGLELKCTQSVAAPCAHPAYLVVVPLDDLQEHGGPVLQGLGEDLQQVAIVIVVNQDLQLLKLKNRVKIGV